jgi:hypothetical protein
VIVGNQRWLERRATFRRPEEQIDTRIHDVALIDRTSARLFVETHHYLGTFPAARFRLGLFERGWLVGVAAFSVPMRDAVTASVFPELARDERIELGRLVLLDRVAGNGESWFVSRSFEIVRELGIAGVVSFSDPVPRTTITGEQVTPGHVGTVYQALNARYLDRGRADTLRLLPDGRSFPRRSYQKIRDGERGWRPAAAILEQLGAAPIAADADREGRCAWLTRWMTALTRPMAHPGNHRYAWTLGRRARRTAQRLGPDRPYPKSVDARAA